MHRYERYLRERRERQRVMASEPPPAANQVKVILKALDARSGKRGDWAIEGPLAQGRDSWVFKAATPRGPWPLAVKVYCSATPTDLLAKRYRQLQRYHGVMADARDTVPAPWAVLPEHRTFISEWIDEPLVGTLLQQAGRQRQRRAELLEATGRWLGRFHRQVGISFAPVDHVRLQQHVDRSLGGMEGAGHSAGDGVFRHSYAVLLKHAEEFARTPVGRTTCHGDFTPTNLFHGPERTVGFDFGSLPGLPVSFDICRFLVGAETSKPFGSRKADLSPQGMEQQDQDAFMAGYGGLDEPLEGRILSYLHLAEVLRRWATLIGEQPGNPFSMTRWLRLRRLRRMAGHAARHLEHGER
ncbi:MAG: hypothetical protein ACOC71_01395 [Hyphomicrobiales bacterium]